MRAVFFGGRPQQQQMNPSLPLANIPIIACVQLKFSFKSHTSLRILHIELRTVYTARAGVGENWLARGGGGVVGAPFPDPPPLLGSLDGAFKKVIDGGK